LIDLYVPTMLPDFPMDNSLKNGDNLFRIFFCGNGWCFCIYKLYHICQETSGLSQAINYRSTYKWAWNIRNRI